LNSPHPNILKKASPFDRKGADRTRASGALHAGTRARTIPRRHPWRALIIGLVVIGTLGWFLYKTLTATDTGAKRPRIQEISLVMPPPPPPLPPPPEIKEEIKIPDPQPVPQEQPAGPPPEGIPEGPAGGMATDIGIGSGEIGFGTRFGWYGALVKERIEESIAKNDKLRAADYRVMVSVWVNAQGLVTRAELANSSGDAELDSALQKALRSLGTVREGAPKDMPQPIKLRITAR
jgi:protein TonB